MRSPPLWPRKRSIPCRCSRMAIWLVWSARLISSGLWPGGKTELSSSSAQTKLVPFGYNSGKADLNQAAYRVTHEKRLCLLKVLMGQDGFAHRQVGLGKEISPENSGQKPAFYGGSEKSALSQDKDVGDASLRHFSLGVCEKHLEKTFGQYPLPLGVVHFPQGGFVKEPGGAVVGGLVREGHLWQLGLGDPGPWPDYGGRGWAWGGVKFDPAVLCQGQPHPHGGGAKTQGQSVEPGHEFWWAYGIMEVGGGSGQLLQVFGKKPVAGARLPEKSFY